jgi:hypothetical protein
MGPQIPLLYGLGRGKEDEKMALSIVKRFFVVAVVLTVVLSALVLTVPLVQAATWTVDTDSDFGLGTLTGMEIIGTGAPAYLQLLKDGMDWRDESPASDPGIREGPAMAYDSTNDVVVLFGGYDGLNLDDTWEYNPGTNTWTEVFPPSSPSARAYSAMAYDSTNNRMVLFGGVSDLDWERDTWEYNAGTDTWQETTPATSPPQATTYHLAFISTQDRILFIGQNLITTLMETWAYNTASDSWVNRAPSAQPSTRSGQAVVYNADLDRVVLFGGFDASVPPGTTLGDTWEYDWGTNMWTQTATTGPAARTSSGLSYWSSIPATFLFGGRDGASYYTDTWRYPNTAGIRQWETVSTQRSPMGRRLFGISDETSAGKSFVFGGRLGSGMLTSDTWSLGPAFRLQGTWVSSVFDSGGANVDWNTISWVGTDSPPTTVIRFQLATSNDPAGPWSFSGPGGSISAYYTAPPAPPQTIWVGHDNERYMKIFAQLYTLDNLVTPTLDSITIDYTVTASNPYIIWTDPFDGQISVPTATLISIRFSESMNTGSVTYNIGPGLSTTPEWSEFDSRLTLNHTSPMLQCTAYTVTITGGTDTGGNPLIGGPVPNPFTFTTICVPPEITSTIPIQGTVDVPLNENIIVDFSEAMDKPTVQAVITPLVSLTPTWSNGDTRVTYTHPDFQQCLDYTVNVTGKDLDGSDLLPGPAPNPWSFRVVCTTPYVDSTSPYHYEIDVLVTSDIVVTFSEPMDKPTVTATITPGITLTPTWSNGDTRVTYTHPDFAGCTAYTVNMTGKDLDGDDLWIGKFAGFADNPWLFVTGCANPYIMFTSPADGDTDVDRMTDITVQFSKEMDNTTVTWDLQPNITLNSSWDVDNKALFLSHTDLFICGVNQMTITGKDTLGNSLQDVLAPNPWTFTPLCPNPYVVSTDPVNDTFGVPLGQDIVVTFSEPMDPLTLVHSLTPPDVTLTPSWSVGDTVVTFTHVAPFNASETYRVFVDGADVDGFGLIPGSIPNPWWFTTAGALPYIVDTNPMDGELDVALGRDIVVNFSEPMNTVTVSCVPSPAITLTTAWSVGDTMLTLSHVTPFAPLTTYTVTCTGQDVDGNDLVAGPVPNPWSFTTVTIVMPEITDTDPPDGDIDVPLGQDIVVTFSEAMDTVTVSCTPSPVITLTPSWTVGDTVLTLSHVTPFAASTLYTVTCTGKDVDGNDLVPGPVPNPWSFTTVGVVPPEAPGGLQVAKVPPSTVRLTWTSVPGADSYNIYESGDRFAAFPWAVLGTTVATTFDANHLADGLTHYYIVRAVRSGLEGPNSTMGVKIDKNIGYGPTSSNIYWFSLPYQSSYARASDISTELTSTRISVVAKWNPAKQTPVLWYHFRNKWRGNDFTINPGDGLYIGSVSAFSWAIVGTDADVVLSFTLNPPPKNNVNWLSIPYTGTYSTASDIANELGSGNITEIGLWNPVTQTTVRWFWTGSMWTGTDFAFSPGDGIYIIIASDFNWQPMLITPEVV